MKPFDRFIASLDHREHGQLRVRVTGDGTQAFVHLEDWFLGDEDFTRQLDEHICLTPDEALSLSAFLRTAVGAIKHEGGQ